MVCSIFSIQFQLLKPILAAMFPTFVQFQLLKKILAAMFPTFVQFQSFMTILDAMFPTFLQYLISLISKTSSKQSKP